MNKELTERPISKRIFEKPLTIWEKDNQSVLGATREHVGFRKIVRVYVPGQTRRGRAKPSPSQ